MDKLIFLNVGWMSKYEGLASDTILGGGKYVTVHGYGHEILNFKPYRGKMYGASPVPHGTIRLERLGAPKGAESVDGVLVVWVAKSKIVGWYENATVYRNSQLPKSLSRSYQGSRIRYIVSAAKTDSCRIDPPDARWFSVPRAWQRKQAMGRYTWFAEGPQNSKFRARVLKYVASGGKNTVRESKSRPNPGSKPHQPDPYKRLRVEKAAIDLVARHFKSIGYKVDSVERDNLGWDLNAAHSETDLCLKLEVKGLSGRGINAELTPREYSMMKKHRHDYRICVATNCLDKNKSALAIFAYRDASKSWFDGDDRPLRIKDVMSAQLSLASGIKTEALKKE